MFKTQNIQKLEGTRLSFHKPADNKDRMIFKVIDMGPVGMKNDYGRKGQQHRKLISDTLKLPMMYQSGTNILTEEATFNSSNMHSVKKSSFEVKKRHMATDDTDNRKAIKLNKNLISESQIKKMSLGSKEMDYKNIFSHNNESVVSKNERVKTLDNIIVKKSTNQNNLFILRNKGSKNSSRVESKMGNRAQSESTQETDNFLSKYHRFVDFPTEEGGKILKRDFNFLDGLSGFEKVETLGKGAYAKVYHIKHKRSKQDYALKIYPKSYLTKPHRITNIRSEVFLLSNLRHGNIVPLLQVYESDDNVCVNLTQIYLLMEKSNSISLDKFLEAHVEKRVSEQEAAHITKQMCEALKYLHGMGISHRDIKLGNVLISDSSKVELIDFGFATMSGETKLTSFCGTPCYMCPEILKKQPYVGYHADIWATGILLYRLVCGTTPFKGMRCVTQGKNSELKQNIIKGEFDIPNWVSNSLRGLLRQMLSMDPRERATVHSILDSPWILKNCPATLEP